MVFLDLCVVFSLSLSLGSIFRCGRKRKRIIVLDIRLLFYFSFFFSSFFGVFVDVAPFDVSFLIFFRSLYIFVTHKILVLLKIIYYYNENELLLSIVKMLQRCIYVIIIGGRVYGREETNETNKCKEDVKI